jgi:subtilisin family serine protease
VKGFARLAVSVSCLIGVLALPLAATAQATIARPSNAASAVPAKPTDDDSPVSVSAEVERAVAAADEKSADPDDGTVRVIVSFDTRDDAPQPSVAAVRSARSSVLAALPADNDVVSTFRHIPAVSLEIDAAGLEALRRHPLVSSVNIDQTVSTTMSDANALIGVAPLHAAGVTGDGVTVAVIDTGVDSSGGVVHPSLADDIAGQACFRTENDCIGGPASAEDQDGHGTHVTGTITGPQGAAPDAEVWALKVFTTGDTSDTNILNALNHVISLNTTTPGTIDIVNMSLGGGNFADQASCDAASTAYVTAFAALNAQGVSVFVATGNDAQIDEISSPGCVTGAIAVGSVGDAVFALSFENCTDNGAPDKVSCFSNATPVQGTGELVDLLAPGCSIVSTGLDGSTNTPSCGTSMATPYAAGAAALILEHAANEAISLTPATLESLMEDTGVPVTDYRMTSSPDFPRVSPANAIGSLEVGAPTGLTINTSISTSTSTSLSWNPVSGATGYQVYVSSNGGASVPVTGGDPILPEFTDSAAECGALVYTVRAKEGTFESLPSNAATRTARPCPLAPTNLQVTALDGDEAFTLQWTDTNPNETGFEVSRSLNGGGFVVVASPGPGSSVQIVDLPPAPACGVYRYAVYTVRGGDRSLPTTSAARGLCGPDNDDRADAEVITPDVAITDTEGGVSYATTEATDPIYSCHFGAPGPGFNGVWYSITPSADTRVTVSTAGTTVVAPSIGQADTLAAIYDASTMEELACNEDLSGSDFRSTVSSNLDEGSTYLVFVSQWAELPPGTVGNLVTAFSWSAPIVLPDNDLISRARVLSTFPTTSTVTNAQNATVAATDLPHSCALNSIGTGTSPRVGTSTTWWTLTPEHNGKLDLDTLASSGSFTDTIMTVYSGSPGALTEVACNDDEPEPGSTLRSELIDVPVNGGTTYYVYVSRWSTTPTTNVGTLVLTADFTLDPGVAITPSTVSVSEDGTPDTYQVRLLTTPSDNVTISIVGDAECSTDVTEMTFAPADVAVTRTVEVSAVADTDFGEGSHPCTITHSVTSNDVTYNGVAVSSVTGTVADATKATVTVARPANGASFVRGAVVTADFACADNKGGMAIASCVGTVANGAPIDTSTAGTKTFTATVTDTLGQPTTVTNTYTVTEPPAAPIAKPDARVKKGRKGTLVGNNIYGTAAKQTVKGAAKVKKSVAYTVSAQNDATFADSFRLKGQGSKKGYTVRYADNKGKNITAAVVAGTYRTSKLAPGKTVTITVKVTVTTKAQRPLARTIVVRSSTQTTRTDAVKVVTSRRR